MNLSTNRLTCRIALLEILFFFGLADAAVIALAAGVAGFAQVFAFVAAFVLIALWALLTTYLMETLGTKRVEQRVEQAVLLNARVIVTARQRQHAFALFCDTGSALVSSDRQPDEPFYTYSVPTPQ